ncbi:glycosyltransferase family 4 protein [bacterium]|nr:glycosyltransferase family 4 protein [bacterium]
MEIGFDITALSMPRTGIGQYQYNLLQTLFRIDPKNNYHLYAFNLRDNAKYQDLMFDTPHNNVSMKAHNIPQRLITAWWLAVRYPRLEQITDECDLYQISEICQQPTKKKTVAFIHDLTTLRFPEYHLAKNKILYHFRFKNIKKYADAILTNSNHTKNDIIKYLRIPENKIHVTYFGAHKRFRHIPDKLEINKTLRKYSIDSPYICYVGTIEPRKNLINLLKAFKHLKTKKKIPHKLVLVGKDGWFFEEIYKTIEKLDLKNDIIRTGFTPDEDIPFLLNGAETFIYPSFYEGFGLPVLEALACGVPTITSNNSSLPEVGENAVKYVNPEDPIDIANKMFEFLNSKDEQKKYSELAIKQASKFSWESCAKETLKVYSSLF